MKHVFKVVGLLGIVALIGAGCVTPDADLASDIPLPMSGIYDYSSVATANCIGGGQNAAGPAGVVVEDDGATIQVAIDDGNALLTFSQDAPDSPSYTTATQTFPVQMPTGGTSSGSIYHTLLVQSSTTITGNAHWDNHIDCTATNPFSLEYNRPFVP